MKNWHPWFSLLKWTHGGSAVRARPRAPSTHCLLLPIPYEELAFVVLPTQMDARRLCRAGAPARAIHALPSPPSSHLPPFSNGRTAALPCGRARARHPRTTFSSLFSMKNWHSWPIRVHSWFSLLKWTHGGSAARARPRAPSTHYLLLPPPCFLPDGSPLHSVHALPSPPSSLFPTFFSFWWKSSAGCIY